MIACEQYIKDDLASAVQVAQAVAALREEGPALGRPLVDRIQGSRIHHLKELRPGSAARSEIRVLFAFDPTRSALLLPGGDKAGNWKRWYKENIPIAEQLYLDYTTQAEELGTADGTTRLRSVCMPRHRSTQVSVRRGFQFARGGLRPGAERLDLGVARNSCGAVPVFCVVLRWACLTAWRSLATGRLAADGGSEIGAARELGTAISGRFSADGCQVLAGGGAEPPS